jgi:hypothetical protein
MRADDDGRMTTKKKGLETPLPTKRVARAEIVRFTATHRIGRNKPLS